MNTHKPTYEELERRVRELERIEKTLRDNQILLSDTGAMAKVGGWELDADSHEVVWTEEIFRIHEIPAGCKLQLAEMISHAHADDRPVLESAVQKALESGEPCDLQIRFISTRGSQRWTRTICQPETKNGKVVKLRGILQDITELKKVEQSLKESENRYKSLFWNNHSVMLVIDPETGEIVDANPSAISFYGWNFEEITRKKITDINMLSEENVFKEMKKAKEEKRKHFFFHHRLANGELRDVEVYSGPIIMKGKTLLYSIIHDITKDIAERKNLERQQEQLNRVLDKKVKERTVELENVNTALSVLLKKREDDKSEINEKIHMNYELLVVPFLEKLKKLSGPNENLVNILESNLQEIISPFSKKLTDPMNQLTPREIQIASMIKQGLSNKEISQILNSSLRTITTHRANIRKKLSITNKKINLQSYLSTLL